MADLSKRIRRIEEIVNPEEGLTYEDVELLLSCLPKDYADAVRKELCKIASNIINDSNDYHQHFAKYDKNKSRSGLHGKVLKDILARLPDEIAIKIKTKIEERDNLLFMLGSHS